MGFEELIVSGKHHVFVADEVAGKMRPVATVEPDARRCGSSVVGGARWRRLTSDVHALRRN